MNIFEIVLFAIIINLDNFIVGVAYGIRKVKITFVINFIIASMSFILTLISMVLGKFLYCFLPKSISNIMGSVILSIMGLYYILSFLVKKFRNKKDGILDSPEKADVDNSGDINVKESITLGLALSLNNIGIGAGASMLGINMYEAATSIFIFSMVSIPLGYIVGSKYFYKLFGDYGELISGVIILLLAIYQLFL
ncbi:sporulation membrane protein YtaF [Clostridium felsineum]|uniref:sporulation membrane protein YtaF n=1 Tax=Clostridium felsineum TaxID=36839 RepID=UPI00098C14A4|nr:sporulation membrane protein YtaF [Clostridium felsineum]MCR3758982.1 sporulation membrane protein YtaF [Clostridium felsineum]URZ18438.1 putative sporulation protein YtaF [Clostridium felsineum DSM 794]